MTSPDLYKQGPQNLLFKTHQFWYHFMKGFFHSMIIIVVMLLFVESNPVNHYIYQGESKMLSSIGMHVLGMQVFGAIILVANLQILIYSYSYTVLTLFFLAQQTLSYLVALYVFGLYPSFECFDYLYKVGHIYTFYFALLAIATLCYLLDLAVTRYNAFSSEDTSNDSLLQKHNFSDHDMDMEDKQSLLKTT